MTFLSRFRIFTIAILLIGILFESACVNDPSPASIAKDLRRSSVFMAFTTYEDTKMTKVSTRGWGSGTIISVKGSVVHVLTAQHLTSQKIQSSSDGSKAIKVEASIGLLGEFHQVKVIAKAQYCDGAIISFKATPEELREVTSLRISKTLPAEGDRVYFTGNGGYTNRFFKEGMISGRCGEISQCRGCYISEQCYVLDRAIFSGFSGGAVVNKNGEIIGVISEQILFPVTRLDNLVPGGGIFASYSCMIDIISPYI